MPTAFDNEVAEILVKKMDEGNGSVSLNGGELNSIRQGKIPESLQPQTATDEEDQHFHVAVFHMKHNQTTAEHQLREMGLEYETFPMGRTLIKNMSEEQFEQWIEPYQGHENTEEDPSPIQDLVMFDDETKAREAAGCWLKDGQDEA